MLSRRRWRYAENIIISHGRKCEIGHFLSRVCTFKIRNEACRSSDERKCERKGGIVSSHIIDPY